MSTKGGINANIDLKKQNTRSNLWASTGSNTTLAKPDKITFVNEPKQTVLAKCHRTLYVTFDMTVATPPLL